MPEPAFSKIRTFRRVWLSALVLLMSQIALYTFLRLRPGAIAFIPYLVGPKLLLLAAAVIFSFLLIQLACKRSLRLSRDWQLWTSAVALAAVVFISLVAYKVFPSSHDGKPSNICFQLPLDGEVGVMQGGATLEVNYHAAFPAQRYAYDLAVIREGKTHRGEGYVVWDYYIYGRPVRSPAEGLVIYTSDGDPDQSPSDEGWLPYKTAAGNHIVLEVGKREYLYLGHLQSGTIRVKAGERVTAGQELARAGNSGRSGGPHLHMHLQDSPAFNGGEGIPMEFCNYLAFDFGGDANSAQLVKRGMPTGKQRKQVVRHVVP
jgi:hypothetical protein